MNPVMQHGDTLTGRGLAVKRHSAFRHYQRRSELDGPFDGKAYDARPARREGLAERTGAAVVQISP
jgi:hypothetical protein